ncbi:MAG: hypothetical protein KF906_01345 [Actinobacteria bacterium]|nr:hypothetical protein [Actinomycetota bacterium]
MLAGTVLGAGFLALSVRDELREQAFIDRTTVVGATVDPTWDGRDLVPVTFTDPTTGAVRHEIVAFSDERPDRDATEVEIRVGEDPADVGPEPYGDHARWFLLMQFGLPAIGGAGLWLAARWRRLRRTRRLVALDEPAYAMQAVALPGRLFLRRWRLALFDVDARPGDRAVCVVPVLHPPLRLGTGPVEVKGRPRPGGEVVAREPDGEVWWPVGRALVGARAAFDRGPAGDATVDDGPPVPVWVWVVAASAVVLMGVWSVGADDLDAAATRSEVVTAQVVVGRPSPGPVTVGFTWDGEQRTAQVGIDRAIAAGETLPVRVDPDDPGRVWRDGSSVAEVDPPLWSSVAFVFAVVLAGVAAAALVSARARPVG